MQYRRCLGLLWATATSVAACGPAPDQAPSQFLDPCLPTQLVPASDTSAEERAGITAALELWEAVAGPPLSLEAAPDSQTLPIGFQRAAPAFFGLYRPDRGDILINRELADPIGRAVTIAHELGHAFGLSHATGQRSLMTPGNLQVPPGEEDVRMIGERRGPCPAR